MEPCRYLKSVFWAVSLGFLIALGGCGDTGGSRAGGNPPSVAASNANPQAEPEKKEEIKEGPKEEPKEKPSEPPVVDLNEALLKSLQPSIVLSEDRSIEFKEVRGKLEAVESVRFRAASAAPSRQDGASLVFEEARFPEKVLEVFWVHRWRGLNPASDTVEAPAQLRAGPESGIYSIDLETLLKKVEAAGGGSEVHGVELRVRFLSGRSAKVELEFRLFRELPDLGFEEKTQAAPTSWDEASTARLRSGMVILEQEISNPSLQPVWIEVDSALPRRPVFHQWIRTFRYLGTPTDPPPPPTTSVFISDFAPELALERVILDGVGNEVLRETRKLGSQESHAIALGPQQRLVLYWRAQVASQTPTCQLSAPRSVTFSDRIQPPFGPPILIPTYRREYDETLGHELDVHLRVGIRVMSPGAGASSGVKTLLTPKVQELKWSYGHSSSAAREPLYSCQGIF